MPSDSGEKNTVFEKLLQPRWRLYLTVYTNFKTTRYQLWTQGKPLARNFIDIN